MMAAISLKKRSSKTSSYLVGVLVLFFMRPYFTWSGILSSNYILFFISILLGSIFLKNRNKQMSGSYLYSFIALMIVYSYTSNYPFISYIFLLPLASIPCSNPTFLKDCLNSFLNIYCIIVSISLFFWCLLILGLLHPYTTIEPLNEVKAFSYNLYPFLVQSNDPNHPEHWFRFHCIFDEAGVVGTISGLILCIKGIQIKNLKCIILILSGICSFSLFFYVLIAIYSFVYYIGIKKYVMYSLIAIIGICVIYYLTQTIPELYDVIGYRFEWNNEKEGFSGDNRLSETAMLYFLSVIGTSEFWLGLKNPGVYLLLSEGSSSVINIIMINGMIFLLLYISYFIFLTKRNQIGIVYFLLFVFVFIATLYQRPNIFSAEYLLLWTCLSYNGKLDGTY